MTTTGKYYNIAALAGCIAGFSTKIEGSEGKASEQMAIFTILSKETDPDLRSLFSDLRNGLAKGNRNPQFRKAYKEIMDKAPAYIPLNQIVDKAYSLLDLATTDGSINRGFSLTLEEIKNAATQLSKYTKLTHTMSDLLNFIINIPPKANPAIKVELKNLVIKVYSELGIQDTDQALNSFAPSF